MTFIDAESNRSRITCIAVVAESDWMRIQNLPNKIRCGVKKMESAHLYCVSEVCGLSCFAIQIQSWFFKTQSKSNHSPNFFWN